MMMVVAMLIAVIVAMPIVMPDRFDDAAGKSQYRNCCEDELESDLLPG